MPRTSGSPWTRKGYTTYGKCVCYIALVASISEMYSCTTNKMIHDYGRKTSVKPNGGSPALSTPCASGQRRTSRHTHAIAIRWAQGCNELAETSIRHHYAPPGTGLQLSMSWSQCGAFADLYFGTYLDSLIYLDIHSKHSYTAWLFLLCTIQ